MNILTKRLPKEHTQRQIAGHLLKRAFEGSARSLVLGALSAKAASADELRDIQRMIETFQKGKGNS
jgi:predicted transcriptional regulator